MVSKNKALLFKVLAHKSFHRCVVRYALPIAAEAMRPCGQPVLTRVSMYSLSGVRSHLPMSARASILRW